jgi:hypothetical protein
VTTAVFPLHTTAVIPYVLSQLMNRLNLLFLRVRKRACYLNVPHAGLHQSLNQNG